MISTQAIARWIVAASLVLASGQLPAQVDRAASPADASSLFRTLSIGVGAGFMRFDTNFKFTDRGNGRSVFIDSEGTLGLPEIKAVPIVYGLWRPSLKHGIGFGYFSVRRESELIAVDENLGDLNVSGLARLTDDSTFYGLTYNYTLFQDDRAYVIATAGVNVIDLEYSFVAEGSVALGGQPAASDRYDESFRQVAPFPTFGLDSWFVLTPKWAIGARAAFVAGDISDVKALITGASIRAKYTVNSNVGLFLGLRYFDADIDITKTSRLYEITYGLDGLVMGIDVGF